MPLVDIHRGSLATTMQHDPYELTACCPNWRRKMRWAVMVSLALLSCGPPTASTPMDAAAEPDDDSPAVARDAAPSVNAARDASNAVPPSATDAAAGALGSLPAPWKQLDLDNAKAL